MKNILILCTEKVYMGNSAASARMMNYASALASPECRVFLCSSMLSLVDGQEVIKELSPNIFLVGRERNIQPHIKERVSARFFGLFSILKYLKDLFDVLASYHGEKIVFLYPSFNASMDYAVLLYVKFIRKLKVYYEINELRRTNIYRNVQNGNFIKHYLAWMLYYVRISKFSLNESLTKYFDGLICISTSLEKYFKRYNRNILRIPILTNFVDNPNPVPLQFKMGDTFKMCFTGFLSVEKEGFNIFYKALEQLNKSYSNFELHLYGYGSKSDLQLLLNALPEKGNFQNKIIYHGHIEQEQILQELKKYDLLILPRNSNPQTDYGFSTKLGEYLSSGVPVLLTDVSDNKLYLKDGENGFIVEAGSDVAFCSKIIYIINNYSEIVPQLIRNAMQTVNASFYFGNYSSSLHEFIK